MHSKYIIILIIIIIITALAHDATICNLSGNNGSQCFGELGKPLLIHHSTRNEEETTLSRGQHRIATIQIKKNQTEARQNCANRCTFLLNGTFMFHSVMKNDSGDYQMETFDSKGEVVRKVSMKLQIQAPVSEPDVSQECVSPEEKKVSCSSKLDDLEFIWKLIMNTSKSLHSWRLDNQSLSSATPEHTNLSFIILPGQLVGSLTCIVRNKVSVNQTIIQLKACEGERAGCSLHIVGLILGPLVVILLMILLLLLCRYRSCKGLFCVRPIQPQGTNQETNRRPTDVYCSMTMLQQGNTDVHGVRKHSDDYEPMSADIHEVQDHSEDYENVKPPDTSTEVSVSPPPHVSSADDAYACVQPRSLRSLPTDTSGDIKIQGSC